MFQKINHHDFSLTAYSYTCKQQRMFHPVITQIFEERLILLVEELEENTFLLTAEIERKHGHQLLNCMLRRTSWASPQNCPSDWFNHRLSFSDSSAPPPPQTRPQMCHQNNVSPAEGTMQCLKNPKVCKKLYMRIRIFILF